MDLASTGPRGGRGWTNSPTLRRAGRRSGGGIRGDMTGASSMGQIRRSRARNAAHRLVDTRLAEINHELNP